METQAAKSYRNFDLSCENKYMKTFFFFNGEKRTKAFTEAIVIELWIFAFFVIF